MDLPLRNIANFDHNYKTRNSSLFMACYPTENRRGCGADDNRGMSTYCPYTRKKL